MPGASDYIAKPVDIDLLLALMRVWIGRARSATRCSRSPSARRRPPEHDRAIEHEYISRANRPAHARPRARILLVDDDERNLMALTEVLKDLAEVVTATSGPRGAAPSAQR